MPPDTSPGNCGRWPLRSALEQSGGEQLVATLAVEYQNRLSRFQLARGSGANQFDGLPWQVAGQCHPPRQVGQDFRARNVAKVSCKQDGRSDFLVVG